MELAELLATEQGREKLSQIVREIDRLLGKKLDGLNKVRIPTKPAE